MKLIASIGLLTVLVTAVVGCGDDSGGGMAGVGAGVGAGAAPVAGTLATGGTGTGGISAGTGSGTGGVTAGTAAPIGSPDSGMNDAGLSAPDAGPIGACSNDGDRMLIDAGDVDRESERCGRMCVLNGAECTVMCMTDAIDVSTECARCFAEIVQCSAVSCALSCFADSEGMPCRDCVATMCEPAFDACAGR